MANTDDRQGLRPVRYLNGAPWDGKVTRYYVDTNNGGALGPGSVVVMSGTGSATGEPGVRAMTAAEAVVTATTKVYVRGVVTEVEYTNTNLDRKFLPSATAGYVFVADDPNLVFIGQEDSGGGNLAVTDINSGVNVVPTTNYVETNTGYSDVEIDSSSAATTQGVLTAKILGLHQGYDLIADAANAVGTNGTWEIQLVRHDLSRGIAS